MSKFTYVGSFLIALTLIIGSVYFPDNFLMSFVSTSAGLNIARGVVAIFMLGLFVSNPPRSVAFRAILGAASISFLTWAINYALSGTIALADSILFLHAALSFAVASLEPTHSYYTRLVEVEDHDSDEREVKVRTTNALA